MSDSAAHAFALPTEAMLPEIWDQHARWLKTVIFARLRDLSAMEEVLQETALALSHTEAKQQKGKQAFANQAKSRTPDFQKPESWGPWLYRVAIRQAMLYRRRVGRGQKLVQNYTANLGRQSRESLATDPLSWLLADERQQMVRQALTRLPKRDVEILLLKHIEDWSYQQIATQLGISPTAVESRLHRARGKLRVELLKSPLAEGTSP